MKFSRYIFRYFYKCSLASKALSVATTSLMNFVKCLNANKFASALYQNSHLLWFREF